MPRTLSAVLVSLFLATPVFAQSPASDAALQSLPSQPVAVGMDALPLDPVAPDSLTGEQLARRIARLYSRQAELIETEATGDRQRYESLLEGLVRDVQLLAERPGVTNQPRFREVYTSVLTEYEQYYDETAIDRGEIYPFLADAFQSIDGIDIDGPLLEHVTLPVLENAYTTVFPMEMNRHVQSYIAFLQRSRGHVSRLRSRADTYFPMVERILAEEGVPDELKYLAMVESALNPRAQSHAGAAGMWQFIRATGRAYGLRAQSDVDDRLNPEKATRAAARHLRDLHERFGDWQLALAGYNCNPARIQREITRAEARLGRRATFWDIYDNIPRETRGYVPMYIATSIVLSNPDAFGLPDAEPGPRYVYDTIPVEGGTSLANIASVLDVNVEVIRALNPSLRRNRIPDQRDPWMLRIPMGYYNEHATALDRFAPRSAQGSALYAAQTVNYGTRAFRPIAAGDGDRALIASTSTRRTSTPVSRTSSTPPAEPPTPVRTVADVAAESAPAAAPSRPRTQTHRVRRGETLSGIAGRYGVTVRQIMNANSLRSTNIRSGQRLRIDGAASTARPGPQTIRHRVTRGQTLSGIARRYGVTTRQIMNWNNLRSTNIRIGQRLRIQTRRNVG